MTQKPYGLSEFAREFEELASNETSYENIAEKGWVILNRLLANVAVATELLSGWYLATISPSSSLERLTTMISQSTGAP